MEKNIEKMVSIKEKLNVMKSMMNPTEIVKKEEMKAKIVMMDMTMIIKVEVDMTIAVAVDMTMAVAVDTTITVTVEDCECCKLKNKFGKEIPNLNSQ